MPSGLLKIKVLIVDDSPTVVDVLRQIIAASPDFEVVAAISRPEQVMDQVRRLKPDVITMDYQMPRLNGADVTRQIMQERPTPILIVTSADSLTHDHTQFDVLQAGAVDMITKDGLLDSQHNDKARRSFLRKLKIVAGVPVIRRSSYMATAVAEAAAARALPPLELPDSPCRLLAVGASTGGPPALLTLLQTLVLPFPMPVLIIQHMGDDFIDGFIHWLRNSVKVQVVKAADGERLRPGVVHVAPGRCHTTVARGLVTALDEGPPLNSCRPSIDKLFFSVAEVLRKDAIGVLLTGMGRDGAQGLKTMHNRGALTIIQDQETSVVFGMPGEAYKLKAHSLMLPLQEIAGAINMRLPKVVP